METTHEQIHTQANIQTQTMCTWEIETIKILTEEKLELKKLNEKNIVRAMKNIYDKEFCTDEMENPTK